MAPETGKSFEVATDALHTEAELWDDWSHHLSGIVIQLEDLVLRDFIGTDHYRAFIAGYEPLRELIVSRCQAGAEEMGGDDGIAAALRWIAKQYEWADRRNQRRMLGLTHEIDEAGRW